MYYKDTLTYEERLAQSTRILQQYPDRIPIIIEKYASSNANNLDELDKKKYLVPKDLTFGELIHVLRKRLRLNKEEGLFFFINDTMIPTSLAINEIYKQHKDEDLYLYILYDKENIFGHYK